MRSEERTLKKRFSGRDNIVIDVAFEFWKIVRGRKARILREFHR